MRSTPVPPDRSRPMPASQAARLDDIQGALHLLRHERDRFERLGFETPQARCQAEIRYWSFLAALHSLPADAGTMPPSPASLEGGW